MIDILVIIGSAILVIGIGIGLSTYGAKIEYRRYKKKGGILSYEIWKQKYWDR